MSEEEKNIQESNNFEQSPDSIVSSIATSEAREAESALAELPGNLYL